MGFCTLLYPTGESWWVRSGKKNIPVSGVDAIVATEEDFQHFKQCILNELAQIEFISADGLEDTSQQD
jgi:hypothetical protein